MSDWSFKNLNLKDVAIARSSGGMKPGRYPMKIKEAEIRDTRSRGKQAKIVLMSHDGGETTDFINIMVPGSEVAQRIGLERLKAIYHYSGHPDAGNGPASGIGWLVNKTVGVVIEEEEYETTDAEGKAVTRKAGKPRRNGAYFFAADLNGGASTGHAGGDQSVGATGSGGDDLDDDEIPF